MADIRDAVYSTGVAVLNRRDMDSIKKYRHSRSRTRNQEIKNRAYIVMMRAAEEKKIKKTKKQKKSVREKKKSCLFYHVPLGRRKTAMTRLEVNVITRNPIQYARLVTVDRPWTPEP